jgi:hypothetical protein
VSIDGRPLAERVRRLAQRFDAIAIGARKQANALAQDAENAARDAATLHEAATAIEKAAR